MAKLGRWGGTKFLATTLLIALLGSSVGADCRKNAGLEPDSGLLHFAGIENSGALVIPEALGVNPLLTWAELEPSEGNYDWASIDSVLAAAAAHEKKVAPRIYTNLGEFGQGTPDWVFDAGAESYVFPGGSVPQPVPNDGVFQKKLSSFLESLGERYNANRGIVFFQTNAGMGGFGEMVWGADDTKGPPGWSPESQVTTSKYWIDRWRAAFPDTALVLMVNFIGEDIGETLAKYAVDRGFYLQANNPSQPQQLVAIFKEHAERTKIVLEIENNGCQGASGLALDEITDRIFAYGFPIDYLVVCEETLDDTARAQQLVGRLRSSGRD